MRQVGICQLNRPYLQCSIYNINSYDCPYIRNLIIIWTQHSKQSFNQAKRRNNNLHNAFYFLFFCSACCFVRIEIFKYKYDWFKQVLQISQIKTNHKGITYVNTNVKFPSNKNIATMTDVIFILFQIWTYKINI